MKLAYSDAQEVLESRRLPEGKVSDEITRKAVEDDLKLLNVRVFLR